MGDKYPPRVLPRPDLEPGGIPGALAEARTPFEQERELRLRAEARSNITVEARTQPCTNNRKMPDSVQPETGQPIPDEAVEAGVKAIKAVEKGGFGWPGYDEERVTEALQAAAPIIRQQALAEAKARVEGKRLPVLDAGTNYWRGWNDALQAALTAIDGSDDE
jgi:hypothetical protein